MPKKAFTIIEMLIVLALIGVLMTVVLYLLDPLKYINRSKDANLATAITKAGNVVNQIYTSSSSYPNNEPGCVNTPTNCTLLNDLRIKSVTDSNNYGVSFKMSGVTTGDNNNSIAYFDTDAATITPESSVCIVAKAHREDFTYFVWKPQSGTKKCSFTNTISNYPQACASYFSANCSIVEN